MPVSSHLISNELAVLALLSRPQLTQLQQQELQQRLDAGINQAFFRQLLDQHKVWGCVYSNITAYSKAFFSTEITNHLHKKYQQGVKRSQITLGQYFQITHAFKQQGITLIPLKGIPLAQRLYHDLAKRHSRDIDLLIKEKDLARSNALLKQLGYQCEAIEALPAAMMPVYFSAQKDLTYSNNSGTTLELHLRLSTYNTKFSEQFTQSLFANNNQNWDRYEEFIYLSWHGAHTLFHRLKWVCDLALFIEQQSLDFAELYRKAALVSKCRAVTTALFLCHHLYKTELPPEAIEYYNHDWLCRQLVTKSLDQLELRHRNSLLFSLYSNLSPILLSETRKERTMAFVQPFNVNYLDLKYLPALPSWLHFSYFFARPFTIFWRRVVCRQHIN